MKTFEEYLEEKEVLRVSPDPAEAVSLMGQAEERLKDLLTLPLTEKNASFRFESAYESAREALQSFLALAGFKPYSHEAIIAYNLENDLLKEREALTLDRYREKRNDINYRGERISLEEAKQMISFAKEIVLRARGVFEKLT